MINFSDKPTVVVLSLGSATLMCALALLILASQLHINLFPRTPAPAPFPAPLTLESTALTARAAILYDLKDGRILFAKNAEEVLPLASLTKIMTAYTVLSAKDENDMVRITEASLKPLGDWGFKVGDMVPLSDLVKMGLVASSNDAMAAAALSLGDGYIQQMNNTASTLGLTHTYFLNSTGLDVDTENAGAYGSARDMATLATAFFKKYPDYFRFTTLRSVTISDGSRTLTAKATTLPLTHTAGFVAAKTGYTDLAGGNLVTIFDVEIGHPVVAVVLGSTEEGRFTDMQTLIAGIRNNK